MTLTSRYQGPRPNDGEGTFAAVAPWWCEDCESPIWREPAIYVAHRQTLWEPEESYYRCPHCGRCDCVNEVTSTKRGAMKVVRRHTIQRHRHELAA